MNLLTRRLAVSGVAILVALSVAACTETAPTDQADAEAALCDSLTVFATSLQEFRDLDPSTVSAEDVEAARDDVQASWDEVKASATDVNEADVAAVDAAWEAVSTAIDEFSTEVPISEALVPVQEAAGQVQAAHAEMRDGAGCES